MKQAAEFVLWGAAAWAAAWGAWAILGMAMWALSVCAAWVLAHGPIIGALLGAPVVCYCTGRALLGRP